MTNKHTTKKFKHVCPRNCPSSCSMISYVENDRLVHMSGDSSHPYTRGKLCAKGFSYTEKNSHTDRLKFPYYQKVKGSGNFTQITWEKAFEFITSEILKIHEHYGNFLPLALFKGSGNIGVHHYVTDEFFSSIGETTRIIGSSSLSTGFQAIQVDMGDKGMSDPSTIQEASIIIIWGANPAATNIHLIPFIHEAKLKGAKLVVIDPIYTQTAEQADLYIQLRPSTDGALANVLIKGLLERNALDKELFVKHGLNQFLQMIQAIKVQECLLTCDVVKEATDLLLDWLTTAKAVSYIIGSGLLKHAASSEQAFRSIEALAVLRGDIGKLGGGIFHRCNNTLIFNNQNSHHFNRHNRILTVNELANQASPPVEMMWISCANPLVQEPNSIWLKKFIEEIPFVVTVDQFLTPTALRSNLILPTTTHFEEMDIIVSFWHQAIALNEQAIAPYYESRSEWNIMRELAVRVNQHSSHLCSFPIHSSEEEYLDEQFNDIVHNRYSIKSISDLRGSAVAKKPKIALKDKQFASKTGKLQFCLEAPIQTSLHPLETFVFVEEKKPTSDYPFWLITPHHPYAFNSQFHFTRLSDEEEAVARIHPKVAKELGIMNGEVVNILNAQACIEIKAVYSIQVPEDIIMIYHGWYPNSEVNMNDLVSSFQTDIGQTESGPRNIPFYDTFVNVKKLLSTKGTSNNFKEQQTDG